jgi:hypothetical protein
MKKYQLLMAKIARALKPSGKLFVHIFTHQTTAYDFEEGWMNTQFLLWWNDAIRRSALVLPKGLEA